MISKFEDIEELFLDIDLNLKMDVNLFIIGGAALLFKGLKGSTKDIDIIVKTTKEKKELEGVLREIGFLGNKLTHEYKNLEMNYILKREDFRIDLFEKQVCSKLSISEGMEDRAKQIFFGKKLNVFVCSNEDILLFKSIARREADINDCIALARQAPNWNIILNEINYQIKKGKDIWVTYLIEGLEMMQKQDIQVPIMKNITDLYKDFMDNISKNNNHNSN